MLSEPICGFTIAPNGHLVSIVLPLTGPDLLLQCPTTVPKRFGGTGENEYGKKPFVIE